MKLRRSRIQVALLDLPTDEHPHDAPTIPGTDEFPIPVSTDYDGLVEKANRMAEMADKHINFESILQGRELGPISLCSEQQDTMLHDMMSVIR